MKKFALLMLVLMFALCSCRSTHVQKVNKEKFTEYSFDWFDTVTTVTGYAESEEEFNEVYEEIASMLNEYHCLYNIYNRYDGVNNMYIVNTSDGAVVVDEKIIDLLEYAVEMYGLTGGKTNVAMGSVLSIWHDYRTIGSKHPDKAALPSKDSLLRASEHVDISKIIIDRENSTVTLLDPEMRIDVGAVAKGYAVEMVARHLEEKGLSGYLINVGGNVRAVGNKPDGNCWTVGIENPDASGEEDAYLEYVGITDEAVVISGSYQRYYIVDGKSYHHIIDSETLMPSERYRSVAVICKDSALGDALSTALFCMTYEDGMALVESLENVEAMWLTNDGEKFYSSGFKKYTEK